MNGQITRAEFVILMIVLVIALAPLVQEGGLVRLLWEGIGSSEIDSGVLATARLGMLLLALVAIIKVLTRKE
jgi:hypothetical protein